MTIDLAVPLLLISIIGTLIAMVAPWSVEWALASAGVGAVVTIGLLVWLLLR